MGKNIAFDLRALQIGHENRGIGMVIRNILERIDDQENTYFFYAFTGNDPIHDLGIKLKIPYTIIQTPRLSTQVKVMSDLKDSFKLTTHNFRALRKLKLNTFVQFDAMLGLPRLFGVKTILIAYDLIPLILKNEYLPTPSFAFYHTDGRKAKVRAVIRSLYYLFKFKVTYSRFRRANSVIAISETVRQSFIDLLHVKPGKIHTLALAAALSTNKEDASIVNKLVADRPYILYVGGTDSRKHIEDIVYAFNITRGRGSNLDLILAGNELKSAKTLPNVAVQNAIFNSPYKDSIHFAGFITDEQKNSLYKKAHAFIFCSIYEGFGLPIIEAQKRGCPVISYATEAIKEVAGESAVLVPINNYTQVAENIGRLFDPVVREKQIKRGYENEERYDWDIFVKGFMDEILN